MTMSVRCSTPRLPSSRRLFNNPEAKDTSLLVREPFQALLLLGTA